MPPKKNKTKQNKNGECQWHICLDLSILQVKVARSVQGQLWLPGEFEANLEYRRLSQKENQTKTKQNKSPNTTTFQKTQTKQQQQKATPSLFDNMSSLAFGNAWLSSYPTSFLGKLFEKLFPQNVIPSFLI